MRNYRVIPTGALFLAATYILMLALACDERKGQSTAAPAAKPVAPSGDAVPAADTSTNSDDHHFNQESLKIAMAMIDSGGLIETNEANMRQAAAIDDPNYSVAALEAAFTKRRESYRFALSYQIADIYPAEILVLLHRLGRNEELSAAENEQVKAAMRIYSPKVKAKTSELTTNWTQLVFRDSGLSPKE